jgi:hypothetical protein
MSVTDGGSCFSSPQLSPRAKQVVARTGHAVADDDPQLVIDQILEVVKRHADQVELLEALAPHALL